MNQELDCGESLQRYEQKHKLWSSWCLSSSEEPNSIEQQLSSVLQHDLEFRIFEAAKEQGNPTLANPLVSNFAVRGYVALQTLGIRKLTEKYDWRRDSKNKWGVISLLRLVESMEENANLISRYNFVCRGGCPYDPPPIEVPQPSSPMMVPEGFGLFLQDDSSLRLWGTATRRHDIFDLLAGKTSNDRNPIDRVDSRLFQGMKTSLESAEAKDFCLLGNKFVFHAADIESRNGLQVGAISTDRVAKLHRMLVRVESLLIDFLIAPNVLRDTTLRIQPAMFSSLAHNSEHEGLQPSLFALWGKLAAERNSWRISAGDFVRGCVSFS